MLSVLLAANTTLGETSMTEAVQVRHAIAKLLEHEDYNALKQEIFQLAKTPHGGFQGELFLLDPLVDLVRDKPVDVVDNVFNLCDQYHRRRNPPSRKTEYQRQYMAERRRRLNNAAKLKQRLDNKLMNASQKEAFRSEMQAWWMVMQEDWLLERGGTRSPELIQQFWDEIDEQLAQGLRGDKETGRRVLGM